MRIFLLTKTPQSERARVCLQLLAVSVDVIVYLVGDGVYNLLGIDEPDSMSQRTCSLGKNLWSLLPKDRIIASQEDLAARGVSACHRATVPSNFYEKLIDDMMTEGNKIYTF